MTSPRQRWQEPAQAALADAHCPYCAQTSPRPAEPPFLRQVKNQMTWHSPDDAATTLARLTKQIRNWPQENGLKASLLMILNDAAPVSTPIPEPVRPDIRIGYEEDGEIE